MKILCVTREVNHYTRLKHFPQWENTPRGLLVFSGLTGFSN